MPTIDVVIESGIDLSIRARQVCGMFDCPPEEKQILTWKADLPIDDQDWNIGLIVGPSGCGKTQIGRHLWPDEIEYESDWSAPTVIDAFQSPIEETAKALSAVGFNTIPAWLRPFHVLSNGEKFRVDMARRILEQPGIIVADEFTSVVHRQVAKIASHSIAKFIRKKGRQFVAISCHDDVIDWLQPDWVFRPDELTFDWRSVQSRPSIDCEVARLPYEAWRIFAPFHYMSSDLHKAARCHGLWVNGELAACAAIMHKPHPKTRNLKAVSRVVVLPDYQGLGLAFHLMHELGAAYTALGYRFRNYPAHPPFIRAHRPTHWTMTKRPGKFDHRSVHARLQQLAKSRPCAVMEYIGPKMDKDRANDLIGWALGEKGPKK